MRKLLIVLLCLVGGMTLLLVGAVAVYGLAGVMVRPSVPRVTLLEVDFEAPMVEAIPDDPMAAFLMRDVPTIMDRVVALQAAAEDDRVAGLVARIGRGGLGMAQLQEIRDAVQAFREAGKFAIAWSETFGEVGPGNGGYYLATAFDEIWLQPSGALGLTGLAYIHPFVKGTLDKVGVTPRMDHRREYKNAMNLFTEESFTEAHRQASTRLLDSWFSQMTRGIGEARGMDAEAVAALVDRGPFLGQEALDAGLVDGLGYRDEVYDRARDRAGKGAEFLYLGKYLERDGRPRRARSKLALVYGVGAVTRGSSGYNAATGEMNMGSDTVAGALRSAASDPEVKAIVFRVDSPGGSYVASDTIWREVVRARDSGKPVVVSMGNLAASGGYFVAMPATRIIAQPGTVTGSIGVLGGKFITREMWRKIGLTFDEVHTSRNSLMWSGVADYSDSEWERVQAWLDRVYEDFTGKVAEGRRMPRERVLEIARGRVWTGEDALEIGLVDELGGFPAAMRAAKQEAGIPDDERVMLKIFPPERSLFDQWFGGSRDSSGAGAAAEAMKEALETAQPMVRGARDVMMGPAPHGVLTMPPVDPVP